MIASIEPIPLRVALVDPFVIANARLDHVDNVAVRVVLDDGTVGWGEIGTLWPITAERYDDAVAAVHAADRWARGTDPDDTRGLAERLRDQLPTFAATRAGIEQAVWDATARRDRIPLFCRFSARPVGAGSGDRPVPHPVVTDITIPICAADRAAELASSWRSRGFDTLKIKVGADFDADLARLAAIVDAHPAAGLVLDANEGWTVDQALAATRAVQGRGGRVALLEQPVPRADLDGLARLTRESGVPVAADEACRSVDDVRRIARDRLASVVNVKIAKSGVNEAVEMIREARRLGLGTMIGAMVESRIGTGFSAHVVAGLGGFDVVDLDTAWLMAEDPVSGGPVLDGPTWRIDPRVSGHGGGL